MKSRILAQLSAADGQGLAGGHRVGHRRTVRLLVHQGRTDLILTTDAARRELILSGATPRRVADGCFEVELWPLCPLARTRRAFARALSGQPLGFTLGRGQITLRGPAPRSAPFRIVQDEQGRLRFRSPLLEETEPTATYSTRHGGRPAAEYRFGAEAAWERRARAVRFGGARRGG